MLSIRPKAVNEVKGREKASDRLKLTFSIFPTIAAFLGTDLPATLTAFLRMWHM